MLQNAATSFFISCCFPSADVIFTTFQNFTEHYLQKDFYHKFSLFNKFTQIPPPPQRPNFAKHDESFLLRLFYIMIMLTLAHQLGANIQLATQLVSLKTPCLILTFDQVKCIKYIFLNIFFSDFFWKTYSRKRKQ